MLPFNQLKRNLKKDFSGLKKIRVAMLGDSATQLMAQAIRATGYDSGFDIQLWEGDFNQIERQVFDPSSEMYEFAPDLVVIFQSSHKLLGTYNKYPADQHASLASTRMNLVQSLTDAIAAHSGASIIYYNYPEINDSVFGNFSNKTESSFLFQLRKLNYELMAFAAIRANFHICDLSAIQGRVGKGAMFQSAVYINTEMTLSIDVLPEVAASTLDLIGAMNGISRKCVILDLDNTLWGGIIGDDGMENIQIGSLGIGKAFSEFQYWLKKLKNRGIILAVCSKNDEDKAREPFEKHPDMVLRPDDIAVFVANWETKVDNIRHIQKILNIGFDSMVFLDDNPFERNIVRENIPGICVPELPEDPAEYLEFLYTQNLFETIAFSAEDTQRTKQYQTEALRSVAENSFGNLDDFLRSLNMVSVIEPFNRFNTPRVAQLSQRSNQFNLRTVRYTEADIANLALLKEYHTFSFTLEDKFGDNGLICVIILKAEDEATLFIETWLMSCRVLKRGMEHFVLNTIADYAVNNGFTQLKGEYIPTPKNGMVKDHYANLGFTQEDNFWTLQSTGYTPTPTHITPKSLPEWTEVQL